MLIFLALCWILIKIDYVLANTEKTIFLGPPETTIPGSEPNLETLQLLSLTPQEWSLRTELPRSFPSIQAPLGNTSVFLLDGLRTGQRYEVRICWIATEPTDFTLRTYTLTEVFDTPELIQALAAEAEERHSYLEHNVLENPEGARDLRSATEDYNSGAVTALFLIVSSAAAFYSTNQSLMLDPPPVLVDIILDPYLLNIFPRSLVPTAVYLVGLAVGGWWLSWFVWKWLASIVEPKSHTD
ncbi:MAG: hypothetical protein M1820_010283 [Bogoriella megaspora]|nr:MAG: hypothetical protein M1820_010283 [Bogoriella megaspora]